MNKLKFTKFHCILWDTMSELRLALRRAVIFHEESQQRPEPDSKLIFGIPYRLLPPQDKKTTDFIYRGSEGNNCVELTAIAAGAKNTKQANYDNDALDLEPMTEKMADFLRQCGCEVSLPVLVGEDDEQIPTISNPEQLHEIIEEPHTLLNITGEEYPLGMQLTGLLVTEVHEDEDFGIKTNGHAMFIPDRDQLSTNLRRRLSKDGEFLIVDNGGGENALCIGELRLAFDYFRTQRIESKESTEVRRTHLQAVFRPRGDQSNSLHSQNTGFQLPANVNGFLLRSKFGFLDNEKQKTLSAKDRTLYDEFLFRYCEYRGLLHEVALN